MSITLNAVVGQAVVDENFLLELIVNPIQALHKANLTLTDQEFQQLIAQINNFKKRVSKSQLQKILENMNFWWP